MGMCHAVLQRPSSSPVSAARRRRLRRPTLPPLPASHTAVNPMNAWLGRSALLALGALLGWFAKAQTGDGGESEWETDSDDGAGPPAAPRRRGAQPAGFSRAPAEELKMVLVVNAGALGGGAGWGIACLPAVAALPLPAWMLTPTHAHPLAHLQS